MIRYLARLERWAWFALLVTLPWQTRIILWQADTSFIEWRSASLWATDVLLLVVLIAGLAQSRMRDWVPDRAELMAGFVFAAAVLSLRSADSLPVGIITLIKMAECWLLLLYVRHRATRVMDADHSVTAFVTGAMLQSGLALAQYAAQHDMGLRWFGETLLDPQMRGVAVFLDTSRERILRAYGTLPHPNILAAYLATSLWAFLWLWIRTDRRGFMRVSAVLLTALLTVGLFVTYARTVIAVAGIGMLAVTAAVWTPRISRGWEHIGRVRRVLTMMLVTMAVTGVLCTAVSWPQVVGRMTIAPTEEAIRLRIAYNERALESGGRRVDINWTGVGAGNFTTWLSRWDPTMPVYMYQPAHNVPLLVYTELGLLGVLALVVVGYALARASWTAHAHQPVVRVGLWALVAVIVAISLMDHFPWTLQQGRLLTVLIVALWAGASSSGEQHPIMHRHD
jgi:hypothetical protein